jgi:hypothetical protein
MPSISIVCLNNPLGAWDESNLEKGIGGSETAAIGLARLLADNGHFVNVFNDVRHYKTFGNVVYNNKSMLDSGDAQAETWIAWRDPNTLLKLKEKSGRKILWLHDLTPESDLLPFIHLCDKIWVQSLFHRGTYPNIPDDKFVVCPSGIIPRVSTTKRKSNVLCYTSDYNRGLDILLEIWPNYKFKFPHDKLVIAYGRQTQDAVNANFDKARGDTLASRQWEYRWMG